MSPSPSNKENEPHTASSDGFPLGSRQERQLMRQRGAGNRQINNIDFGFAFATPGTQRRHIREPSIAERPLRKSLRTPVSERHSATPVQPLSTASARSTRSVRFAEVHSYEEGGEGFEQSLTKRRKLGDITNVARAISKDPSNTQVDPVAQDKVKKPALSSRIAKSQSGLESFSNASQPSESQDRNNEQEHLEIQHTLVKSVAKRKKRKSISQQSLFKKKQRISSERQLATVALEDGVRKDLSRDGQPSKPSELGGNDYRRSLSIDRHAQSHDLSPVQITRRHQPEHDDVPANEGRSKEPLKESTRKARRRRKSIVRGKTKHRSITPVERIAAEAGAIEKLVILPPQDHEPTRTDLTDEDNQSIQLSSKHQAKRPMTTEITPLRIHYSYPEDQSSEDEYRPDDFSPEQTPARPRTRTKPSKSRPRPQPSSYAPSRRPPSHHKATSFPIAIHRIVNADLLPTIAEEPHSPTSEAGVDNPTTMPAITSNRSKPNAVDVVSQVFTEIIDKHIHNLTTTPGTSTPISKAALKAQVTALNTFSTNLQTQFLTLSQTLDHRLHLEARLRKSRREKATLQAQWLAIRHRRDELALRTDAIRREHWEQEAKAQSMEKVSEAAWKVEMSMNSEGDEAEQTDGLEFLLRRVAGEVSRQAETKGRGGVIDKVRRLNDLLEGVVDGK